MSFPGIIRRLFANNGAGPLLRGDIIPPSYGTCSTAAGTAAKVVSLLGFVLGTGAEVTVRFTVTNTASTPTLNVNGTGAKPIRYLGAAVPAGYLAAGRIYRLLYDGAYWNIVGDVYIHAGSVSEEQEALRKSMIGVPRYWRSTTLPANHCWANGDFVSFADWPELKEVYDAGGFQGMLMAWNADSKTKAANLGKWRPDAAEPTGLYTPNLTGQFLRCWADGGDESAGAWHRDEIRNIYGIVYDHHFGISPSSSGALIYTQDGLKGHSASGSAEKYGKVSLDASKTVPTGVQNVPQHVWQPVIFYLGQPSA